MDDLDVAEKGFVLSSVLATYMYLKESCKDSQAMKEFIQQDDSLTKVKNKLLLNKAFSNVPNQEVLFIKSVKMLKEEIFNNENPKEGIETKLFELIKKLAKHLPINIKKEAINFTRTIALEDDKISANEQNFMNQIDNLLKVENNRTTPTFIEKKFFKIATATSFLLSKPIKAAILLLMCVTLFFFIFNKKTTYTHIAANFKGYEKIDKLYTSFTVVPLIKKSYSSDDSITSFWKKTIAERKLASSGRILNGFIVADYDMAIGYDNVSKIIGKFAGKKCPSDVLDNIPYPTILSIKANVHPPEGDATSIQNSMYVTPNNEKSIKNKLIKEMKDTGQWTQLMTRGKNVLKTYISLYCTEEN